jgi:hypothetical protein
MGNPTWMRLNADEASAVVCRPPPIGSGRAAPDADQDGRSPVGLRIDDKVGDRGVASGRTMRPQARRGIVASRHASQDTLPSRSPAKPPLALDSPWKESDGARKVPGRADTWVGNSDATRRRGGLAGGWPLHRHRSGGFRSPAQRVSPAAPTVAASPRTIPGNLPYAYHAGVNRGLFEAISRTLDLPPARPRAADSIRLTMSWGRVEIDCFRPCHRGFRPFCGPVACPAGPCRMVVGL